MNASKTQLEIKKLQKISRRIKDIDVMINDCVNSLSDKVSTGEIPHVETRGRKVNEEAREEIKNLLFTEGKSVTEVSKITGKSKAYISQMKSVLKD